MLLQHLIHFPVLKHAIQMSNNLSVIFQHNLKTCKKERLQMMTRRQVFQNHNFAKTKNNELFGGFNDQTSLW